MTDDFHKRIFTPRIFFSDLGFLASNLPRMVGALRNPAIGRSFTEKIMTVITAVNGCDYCSWFHAKVAMESGISEEEVVSLLSLEFEADADPHEVMALLYAQHFAETDRNPDPAMTARLVGFYGERTSRDIILFMRMISFGNLLGNTWDAVLSRFGGHPARNGNLAFEIFFFLLTFWFMAPAMLIMRLLPARLPSRSGTTGLAGR